MHAVSRQFQPSSSLAAGGLCPWRHHRHRDLRRLSAAQPAIVAMTRRTAMLAAEAATAPPHPTSPSESRVLVAHLPPDVADTQGCILHLKNPKTGSRCCYMLINGILQELHWFKQPFSSWFIGNHVLEDGSLYMCTPIDPLYLLLPILDESRMKRVDDLGKFRSLEEILYVESYPGYCHLQPLLQQSLDAICEVRDIGGSKFYRLDDSKVLFWLCCKVRHTIEGLNLLGGYGAMSEMAKKVHAVGLIGDYVKEIPWLEMLCDHFSVDLNASKKMQQTEATELVLLCESKTTMMKKHEKVSSAKSKVVKKSTVTGMRKVTQFFATER